MSQMKLKGVKKKRRFKVFFFLIITYILFSLTFYYSFKNNKNITNEEFIKFLLTNGNPNFDNEYKLTKVVNNTVNYILSIDITKPVTLFNDSIIGNYVENNISKDSIDEYDINKLKEISSYISDPYEINLDSPIIYIYNSHQLENYSSKGLEIYGITPNVMMASYLLREKLNSKGLSTIVEDANLTEFITLNNWNYNYSYYASRMFLLDKKNTYPSLKYFIDIHRDSVSKDLTTVKINNQDYAKILFVVGLEHKNYEKNLSVMNKINDISNKLYPGLSKGILKKSGDNVNGIYNQDISPNTILIEIGGVDNNINEVLNTINALSNILYSYIKG